MPATRELRLSSYYLGKILVMIGYTDTNTKTMINLGNVRNLL